MGKVDPRIIEGALKAVDRLVSAYERSCEIELEKEKVAADLKLGLRRIDLEEKRLNAELKVEMRRIAFEERKIEACIQEMGTKVHLLEEQQKRALAHCDKLVEKICETKDEKHREVLQRCLLNIHSMIAGQLSSSSENFNLLLSSTSSISKVTGNAQRRLAYSRRNDQEGEGE